MLRGFDSFKEFIENDKRGNNQSDDRTRNSDIKIQIHYLCTLVIIDKHALNDIDIYGRVNVQYLCPDLSGLQFKFKQQIADFYLPKKLIILHEKSVHAM